MPGTSFPPSAILRNDSAALADLIDDLAGATPTTEPVAIGVVWRSSGDLVVSAGIPPAFTTHPQSQTIAQGSTVTFTWAATNATSFQLQKQEGGVGAWANVSGATSSPWTSGALTNAADNGDVYRVVATGPGGTTNSNSATLTVNIAVTVYFEENFSTARDPIASNTQFAATIGNIRYLRYGNSTVAGGKLVVGSSANFLCAADNGNLSRPVSGSRIHISRFRTSGSSGDYQTANVLGLTTTANPGAPDEPGLQVKTGGSGIGDLRDARQTTPTFGSGSVVTGSNDGGYLKQSAFTTAQVDYEACIIERVGAGSFSLIRVVGGNWNILNLEKQSVIPGRLGISNAVAQGIESWDWLASATSAFLLTPLVASSALTGASDGSGQPESGGSGVTPTIANNVTIYEAGTETQTVYAEWTYQDALIGMVLRAVDSLSYILCEVNPAAATTTIFKVIAGTKTPLASSAWSADSFAVSAGNSFRLVASVDENNIIRTMMSPGSLHSTTVQVTDATFSSATKCGVKNTGTSTVANFACFETHPTLPTIPES